MITRRFLRIKVLQNLYSYFSSRKVNEWLYSNNRDDLDRENERDLYRIERTMERDINSIEENYLFCLELLIALRKFIQNNKKDYTPILCLEENVWLNIIEDRELKDRKNTPLCEIEELLFPIAKTIMENEKMIEALQETDLEKQKNILYLLIRDVLLKNELVNEWMNKKDLFWEENKIIIKNNLKNLIKNIELKKEMCFVDQKWEDEYTNFYQKLFHLCIQNEREHIRWIRNYAHEWDIDRIYMIDKILLLMSFSELLYFHNIPIKTTFNEYIEIAKSYSTDKSKIFINGLLAQVKEDLERDNKIKKTAKGYME